MAQPLGLPDDSAASTAPRQAPPALLRCAKKKGCRKQKCSKWKGGKCRCGRE